MVTAWKRALHIGYTHAATAGTGARDRLQARTALAEIAQLRSQIIDAGLDAQPTQQSLSPRLAIDRSTT